MVYWAKAPRHALAGDIWNRRKGVREQWVIWTCGPTQGVMRCRPRRLS